MTLRILLIVALTLLLNACSEEKSQPMSNTGNTSTNASPILGKSIYISKCAACHGQGGAGSNQAPPLVHKIYKPGHHADYSFHRAVTSGVRSHHWSFGNMPAIAGVSPEDTDHIIAYIRQQQRLAGIR